MKRQTEGPESADSPGTISRRTVAKAVAWSVPVIAFAAPAPAFAASGDITVAVSAQCGPGATGQFTISTSQPIPVGEQLIITLTHTGGGTFTATPNFLHTGTNPFAVAGTGALFSGTIAVSFVLGLNGVGTVTATVTGSSGLVVSGDTTSSIRKRRDGNSQNYECSAA